MSELVSIIAVAAVTGGAILSTLKGYWGSPEPYKFNRLLSSLVISAMAALSTIQFSIISDQLTQFGFIGLGVTYLLVGFGLDQGLSKLDK